VIRLALIAIILFLFALTARGDQWCEWVVCEKQDVCYEWEKTSVWPGPGPKCLDKKLEMVCDNDHRQGGRKVLQGGNIRQGTEVRVLAIEVGT
jgi:hypothetical protein